MTPTQARLAAERKERLARIASRAVLVEVSEAIKKDAKEDQREAMNIREAESWLSKKMAEAPKPAPKQFWFSIADRPGEVSIQTIQRVVAEFYKISVRYMTSNSRKVGVTLPRHVAFYLARTRTGKSMPDIGRRFGGRDHTTVLHGVRRIKSLIVSGHSVAGDVEEITEILDKLAASNETDSHSPDRLPPEADAPGRSDQRAFPVGGS